MSFHLLPKLDYLIEASEPSRIFAFTASQHGVKELCQVGELHLPEAITQVILLALQRSVGAIRDVWQRRCDRQARSPCWIAAVVFKQAAIHTLCICGGRKKQSGADQNSSHQFLTFGLGINPQSVASLMARGHANNPHAPRVNQREVA